MSQRFRFARLSHRLAVLSAMALSAAIFGPRADLAAPAHAETPPSILTESPAYSVSVENIAAKVGAHAVLRAVLHPKPGYRILKGYENRVARFSALDDGVAFDAKMVRGKLEDDGIAFDIGLTPTKPGAHPINAVFRVGYIQGDGDLSMVSLPLIATVTGTE